MNPPHLITWGPFPAHFRMEKKTPCSKGKLILKNWSLLKLFSIWRGHTHQIWGVHNFMPWPPQNHWVPQKKGCFAATRKTLGKGSRNFGPPMFVGFPRFAQKSCYILTITICISFLVKTLMFDGEIAIFFRGELPCPTGQQLDPLRPGLRVGCTLSKTQSCQRGLHHLHHLRTVQSHWDVALSTYNIYI
jgi:hypothetical protein